MVSNVVEQASKTQAELYFMDLASARHGCPLGEQVQNVVSGLGSEREGQEVEAGDQQSLSSEKKESNGIRAGGTYLGASEIFIGCFLRGFE